MSSGSSSPRAGGGGLCKAFKDMKSKVATHTGMSLSFVELVATSPVTSLLPAVPPSPRSPSALLHRRMHSSFGFVARRASSAERRPCADANKMDTQSLFRDGGASSVQSSCANAAIDGGTVAAQNLCSAAAAAIDVETVAIESLCAIIAEADESLPAIELSCSLPAPLCDEDYGCFSSASQVHPTFLEHSSAYKPSSVLSVLSSPECSSCDVPCPDSLSLLASLSCDEKSALFYHHAPDEIPSSSSPLCNACPSSSTSSSSPWPPLSSSPLLTPSSHSLLPGSCLSCKLSTGDPSSSCNYSDATAEGEQKLSFSTANKLSSNNQDCTGSFCSAHPDSGKHATIILQVKSQIPSSKSLRLLYAVATLICALSIISKSFYKSCMWGASLSRRILTHHIRVVTGPGLVKTKSEDDTHDNDEQVVQVDAIAVQPSLQGPRSSCVKRSKLLKSKLRSSFKSLSVQVPRIAITSLHSNSFPISSSSSSLSAASPLSSASLSESPPSPWSFSDSPDINGSPMPKKTRMLRCAAFTCKLRKSINQRLSHTTHLRMSAGSPTSCTQRSPTRQPLCSPSSSCELEEFSSKGPRRLSKSRGTKVVPLITIPLALCVLLYGRLFAFSAISLWLLVISIGRSVCIRLGIPSQFCNP